MVCDACFDRFFPLNTLFVMLIASGPDKRITPIAPLPEGVANATMVSLFVMILLLKLLFDP